MASPVMRAYVDAMNTTPKTMLLSFARCGVLRGVFAAIFALFLSGLALAEDSSAPAQMGKQSANKSFLEKAYKESCEEACTARVVAERSTHPEVREFASTLASTHTSMDEEIAKLASKKGITLTNRDSDDTKIMEKWAKKDLDDLNEDFVDDMVDSHQDTVELFQEAATNTDLDPALSEYARKTLPALQKHLARAKQLDKSLN